MAIGPVAFFVLAAPDVVEIPLDVPQHNEIEKPVSIQIHPRCAGGPSAPANPGFNGHVGKCSIAVVMVQLVSSVRGYVKVFVPVIVVVAHDHTHAVSGSLQTCLVV